MKQGPIDNAERQNPGYFMSDDQDREGQSSEFISETGQVDITNLRTWEYVLERSKCFKVAQDKLNKNN